MGNGMGDTLIGNGGDDYLDGRGGGALLEGAETQVVFLNFLPGAVDYSSLTIRDAIEARMAAIYGDFNYTFTQTVPTSGPYAEIDFNVPAGTYLGGEATELDFRNLDLGGSATVDISQFLQFPGLVGVAGLPAATTENIINMSATIAAHELGHLSGLLHEDAFGPIGSGVSTALTRQPEPRWLLSRIRRPVGRHGNPVRCHELSGLGQHVALRRHPGDLLRRARRGQAGLRRLGNHGRTIERHEQLARDGPADHPDSARGPEHASGRTGRRDDVPGLSRRRGWRDHARGERDEQRRLLRVHRDCRPALQFRGPVADDHAVQRRRHRPGADAFGE